MLYMYVYVVLTAGRTWDSCWGWRQCQTRPTRWGSWWSSSSAGSPSCSARRCWGDCLGGRPAPWAASPPSPSPLGNPSWSFLLGRSYIRKGSRFFLISSLLCGILSYSLSWHGLLTAIEAGHWTDNDVCQVIITALPRGGKANEMSLCLLVVVYCLGWSVFPNCVAALSCLSSSFRWKDQWCRECSLIQTRGSSRRRAYLKKMKTFVFRNRVHTFLVLSFQGCFYPRPRGQRPSYFSKWESCLLSRIWK